MPTTPAAIKHNKAQRFVLLLGRMQESEGLLAEAAMETFDLDDRTLRRYLADLRDIGVPVNDEGRGKDRRLSVDPVYGRKFVQLNLLERVSLQFGRTLYNFLEGTGFAEDMDTALERMNTWSGGIATSRGPVEHVDRKLVAVPEHAKDHTRDADKLDDLLTCVLDQVPCEAHYARVGAQPRKVLLHPYTLAHWRQGLYVFALDVEQGRIKTYAVDRFRSVKRCRGERFEYPEDYAPGQLLEHCFGIIGGAPERFRLWVSRGSAPYVRERTWHHSQLIREQGGGEIELEMHVGRSPELEAWILSFGPHMRVLEPADLGERIRQLHADAARK